MDPIAPGQSVPDFQVRLMAEALREIFGRMDDEVVAMLRPMVEFVEVAGGEAVVRQGGTDSDLYFVITGRLRAYGGDGPQRRRFLREARALRWRARTSFAMLSATCG